MIETWKTIGKPFSKYEVSDQGRVKNKSTNYVFNNKNIIGGYIKVSLIDDDGKQCYKLIHILVANVFLKKKNGVVNHKDGNKVNNCIKNLEFISQKENCGLARCRKSTKSRAMDQFDLDGNFIKRWGRIKDIPYGKSNIGSSAAGRIKSAYGFIWKYVEEKIENEEWRQIAFNQKIIKVSNKGRIQLPSGKITYGYLSPGGYKQINIDGKSVFVHRLVAICFLGEKENLVVNHKDLCKTNNCVENLEWITQQENSLHGKKNWIANPRKTAVKRISPNGEMMIFKSIEEAAIKSKVIKSNICMVCKKQRKTAGGFVWEYADE